MYCGSTVALGMPKLSTGTLAPRSGISRAVLVPHLERKRREAALSQKDLAQLAGVSRATIGRGEDGEDIRLSSVRKLALALKCRPVDLTGPLS